jgi:hypothetical protein
MRSLILFLLLALQAIGPAVGGEEGCLKMVFGDYCLGGAMQQQLQRHPKGIPAPESGARSAVVYPKGREHTYVMAYQGRIYKVLHTYEPVNQVTFKDLRKRLESKYGAYLDHSHYPAYARTKASRISSIRRGEGALKFIWSNTERPWRIELEWTRKLGISISYLANDLEEKQKAAMIEGL